MVKFHRPFAFINSTITAYDIVDPNSPTSAPTTLPQDQSRIIGEVQQEWHLLRRKYNLFVHRENTPGEQGEGVYQQFAYVDEPFLSW